MELEASERGTFEHVPDRAGCMMIDNPVTAMDLLDKLNATLPIPTRLTPGTQALLRKQIKSESIPSSGQITWLHYM